jgi:hypothetical protein
MSIKPNRNGVTIATPPRFLPIRYLTAYYTCHFGGFVELKLALSLGDADAALKGRSTQNPDGKSPTEAEQFVPAPAAMHTTSEEILLPAGD